MSDRATQLEKQSARELDKALSGTATAPDTETAGLVAIADRLRDDFAQDVPENRAQRALFVQAAGGAHRSFRWVRFFGPATVTALVLIVAIMLGRSALPGQTFYPVRQALRAVGLASFSLQEIDDQITAAQKLLVQAEGLGDEDPARARALAFEAVKVLGFAERLLPEVASDGAEGRLAQVQALLVRAEAILVLGADNGDLTTDDQDDTFGRGDEVQGDEAGDDDGDDDEGDQGDEGDDDAGDDDESDDEGEDDDGSRATGSRDDSENEARDGDDDEGPNGGADRENDEGEDDSIDGDDGGNSLNEDDEDEDTETESKRALERLEDQGPRHHLADQDDDDD